MFPEAIRLECQLVGHPLSAFILDQAFALATFINDNDPELRVNLPFAIPVTAGCAYLYFSGKNQLFAHIGLEGGFGQHESLIFTNGSMKFFDRWL